MLFRGYYQHCPSDILLKLYLSTVRPHMEYASCIWHPHTQKHIKQSKNLRNDRLHHLKLPLCRTERLNNSFPNWAIRIWNNLPPVQFQTRD